MITAAQVLAGAGEPVDTVAGLFPGIHLGRVEVRVAGRWMARVWMSHVVGMAGPRHVYLRPGVDDARIVPLLVHELAHVAQWRRDGAVRFLGRYLGDYLMARMRGRGHRLAYTRIRYEAEARAVAEAYMAARREDTTAIGDTEAPESADQ